MQARSSIGRAAAAPRESVKTSMQNCRNSIAAIVSAAHVK